MSSSGSSNSFVRFWTYGSQPGCTVVVTGAGIAPQHCVLSWRPEGFALEDLGSTAGTWVNGVRLAANTPVWVKKEDQILVGTLRLPWPETEATNSPAGTARPYGAGGGGSSTTTRTIGRGPDNDVTIDLPMISWAHARLIGEPGGRLYLEDLGSTNGTAVGRPDKKITRAEVRPTDQVYLGSFRLTVEKLLAPGKVNLGGGKGDLEVQGSELILGRDPSCDFPISSPQVSWHHARLKKSPQGLSIEDLGSRNGTFVNGVRITSTVELRPGGVFGLGPLRFTVLDASGRLEQRDCSSNVTIEAVDVTVEVRKGGGTQRLLDPVSLTVFPFELVALMGLAGAGKTTLMKALNGYTLPSSGRVLFNGEDLYRNQDQFRLQVGYVPQDDILHPQLTVREALRYTAQLRTDLRPDERERRISTVLKDLGIEDIGERLIGSPERKVISGGQRKRVNIAMELLSDPSVLFLDEPTSGLSSYDAHQVVCLLRRLADKGKTVICTIHQPSLEVFKNFDSLMIVARDKGDRPGTLAYFGPAYPASLEFFTGSEQAEQDGLSAEDLMTGLASKPAGQWRAAYVNSPFHRDFVVTRAGQVAKEDAARAPAARRRDLGIGQFLTLLHRNVLLKARDRTQTLILLGQAPLFALLLSVVFQGLGDEQFKDPAKWAQFCGKLASTHFLLVVAGVWFGCNNAARDIVGETSIFFRERMVNLKLPSYVFSKLVTLALICLFQCVVLLAIVYFVCGLSGNFAALLGILLLSSITGAALGLLISCLAPTTEAAIAFLPVVLLPFILLGGGIKPVSEMPATAQWIASLCPTRWAYEASILQEAESRKATFRNELEEKLLDCQQAVGQCQGRLSGARGSAVEKPKVREERDIAATAFPASEGRSSLTRSVQVLGVTLSVYLILLLSALSFKKQH